MLRRSTRYAIGLGLAVVLALAIVPVAVDGDQGVDLDTVKFGPTFDPNGSS